MLFTLYSTTLKLFSYLENRLLDLTSSSHTITFVLVHRLSRRNKNEMICSKLISNSQGIIVASESQSSVSVFGWRTSFPPDWMLANLQSKGSFAVQNITCSHQVTVSTTDIKKNNNNFSEFSLRISVLLCLAGWYAVCYRMG